MERKTLQNVKLLDIFVRHYHRDMRVLNKDLVENFAKDHADSRAALNRWIQAMEEANWKTHAELKQMFPSADYTGNSRYVFNIRGNNYRVVVAIVFIAGLATIRFVGTHAEYDKIDCSTI